MSNIKVFIDDIPSDFIFDYPEIAIDTEAMGLKYTRDRLCTVQCAAADGFAFIVHFKNKNYEAPNLKKLLSNIKIKKIFHFARFDMAIIQYWLNIEITNVFCTKIASKICRTYSELHGLKSLCKILLGVDISKTQQTSDWGADLSKEQIDYACQDVLYLHRLKIKLIEMLERENRLHIAENSLACLPAIIKLDIYGWGLGVFEY